MSTSDDTQYYLIVLYIGVSGLSREKKGAFLGKSPIFLYILNSIPGVNSELRRYVVLK